MNKTIFDGIERFCQDKIKTLEQRYSCDLHAYYKDVLPYGHSPFVERPKVSMQIQFYESFMNLAKKIKGLHAAVRVFSAIGIGATGILGAYEVNSFLNIMVDSQSQYMIAKVLPLEQKEIYNRYYAINGFESSGLEGTVYFEDEAVKHFVRANEYSYLKKVSRREYEVGLSLLEEGVKKIQPTRAMKPMRDRLEKALLYWKLHPAK